MSKHTMNPKSLEAIRDHQFQRGYDSRRNLGGRPKRTPFTDELRQLLEESDQKGTRMRELARTVIARALRGNIQAVDLIACRLEGKPKQNVELSTAPGGLEFHAFRHMTIDELDAEIEAAREVIRRHRALKRDNDNDGSDRG